MLGISWLVVLGPVKASLDEGLTEVVYKYNFLESQVCDPPRPRMEDPRYAQYGHDLEEACLEMDSPDCGVVVLSQCLLGAGSTGTVFRGVLASSLNGDSTPREVAVKMPLFDQQKDPEGSCFQTREYGNLRRMNQAACPYVAECLGKLKTPGEDERRFHMVQKLAEGEKVAKAEISKEGVVMEYVQGGREDHYISHRPGNRIELEGHFIQVVLLSADLVRRGLKHGCLHTWNLVLRHDQVFKYTEAGTGDEKQAARLVLTSYYALQDIEDTWIEKLTAFTSMVQYYLFYVELLADKMVLAEIAEEGEKSRFGQILTVILNVFLQHRVEAYSPHHAAEEVAEVFSVLETQFNFLQETFRNDGHHEQMDNLTIVPAYRRILLSLLQ